MIEVRQTRLAPSDRLRTRLPPLPSHEPTGLRDEPVWLVELFIRVYEIALSRLMNNSGVCFLRPSILAWPLEDQGEHPVGIRSRNFRPPRPTSEKIDFAEARL
jgi:hypothetical protein